jgi:2-polyprenyl-3-methyl-5-hydroxy-6-metoxy-1,4-benzoquinol methylase
MSSVEWDRRYRGSELVWTARPNRFLVAEAAELPPGRALDLAAGEGRNAVWLAEQGWRGTGVDFSRVGLEKAERLAAERGVHAKWVHADLVDYRPTPRAFDLVVVFHLQVPQAQRRRVLRAAAEAVATSGTLLVVAHDSTNLEHGYGGPRDAAVLYSPEDVVRDLEGSVMEIERAEVVVRTVDTLQGEREALDALVRASRARSSPPRSPAARRG